ncbi:hypothetical protein [Streptomyces litchfieldiae]|uniref:Nucleotide exchange factor GrpE n=1 Tax=Streptomyces litchfieldiae TaxID=3075543 RepID=A0ABU2MKS3_9ACTN|nr:hypothetical protein [Streptomyces sp. DSM 44938]MDT0341983.1 hypothetical protein [Streptomyces sp. DSM 44938]
MSSSAETTPDGAPPTESSAVEPPLDWADFAPLPAPDELPGVPPDRELAAVLQRIWSDRSERRNEADAETARTRKAAADLAVHVARLEYLLAEAAGPLEAAGKRNLRRRLDVVRKQMADELAEIEVVASIPTGRPFEEVADEVDVLRWRHSDEYTAEFVIETVDPVVRDRGVVVRFGQVVVGAPRDEPLAPEQAAEQGQSEQPAEPEQPVAEETRETRELEA